jgi:hypothetical protein
MSPNVLHQRLGSGPAAHNHLPKCLDNGGARALYANPSSLHAVVGRRGAVDEDHWVRL